MKEEKSVRKRKICKDKRNKKKEYKSNKKKGLRIKKKNEKKDIQ